MVNWIGVFSIIGLLLSLYAVRIHIRSKFYKGKYKEVCDISDRISCTQVLNSDYGRIFLMPNSFWGVLFYLLVFAFTIYNFHQYVIYASIIAVLGSLVLAYLQYFKLKNFCLVCTSVYIVNFLLLIFSFLGI